MNTVQTITYDDKAQGRKMLPFPPEFPFYPHLDELGTLSALGAGKDSLRNIVKTGSTYDILKDLYSYLSLVEKPYVEILKIASLAAVGEPEGIKLLYALFAAVPPLEAFLDGIVDFTNVRKVMEECSSESDGESEVAEKEEWFRKKVMLLSVSLPLPNSSSSDPEKPWLSWGEGVRRAFADPDDKWSEAIIERAKVECEAKAIRIGNITAVIDAEKHERTVLSLMALVEEIRWKQEILTDTAGRQGSTTMFLRESLGAAWEGTINSLKGSKAGHLLAEMLETQAEKAHTYPQIRSGTAVLRSLTMHPALQKTTKTPDILSCLHLYIVHAGEGKIDILLPLGKKVAGISDLPGFSLSARTLSMDLSGINTSHFVSDDWLPIDVDWVDMSESKELSIKSLVMSYIDNDSFLAQLLNNPKATNKPGIVSLIAQRCRSMRILSLITNRRDLHTGFTNKIVPMHIIMSPAKIPITSLRKFIHVRYVDKMTLIKLSQKGGGMVREEVRREIERYLRSSS
ncbi:MAG: hypothetical protein KAV42_01400 [Candidatus Krumholzibacteria bacterium]|nr:hypothetical protein [Candidatus Krumholzibacteria bacterium]